MLLTTFLALLTFATTSTRETSTSSTSQADATATSTASASDPTKSGTREPDPTAGTGLTAPPPDGLPPQDPTLPLAEQPPPPIELVAVGPVDDQGRGLIERVSPRFAADDITWLGNLDLEFQNTGAKPVEITSVDLTWVGAGQATDTWKLGALYDLEDDDKTFLGGVDFYQWGTRALPSVTGAPWGFWSDAVAEELDDHVVVSGTAFDGGSRLVVSQLTTWGTPQQERRLFANRNGWSAGLETNPWTVFVAAQVEEDDAWGSFAFAGVDRTDFSAPTDFGERRYRNDFCDVTAAWDTAQALVYAETADTSGPELMYVLAVAGTADCVFGQRGLVLVIDELGEVVTSFGAQGFKALTNPTGEDSRALALSEIRDLGRDGFVVAVESGEGCADGLDAGQADCRVYLHGLDETGAPEPAFGKAGVVEVTFDGSAAVKVHDLVFDPSARRLYVAGWAVREVNGTPRRHWAVARYRLDGSLDGSWSMEPANLQAVCQADCGQGVELVRPLGLEGGIKALHEHGDELVAVGWVDDAYGSDMAAARFDATGHLTVADQAAHYFRPGDGDADGRALTLLDDGRILGFGVGHKGKWTTARWLEEGPLDRLDVLDAGETMTFWQPDPELKVSQPTKLQVAVHAKGFVKPATFDIPLAPHDTPLIPGYGLPIDPASLPAGYTLAVAHTHESGLQGHRKSPSQRYALDIVAKRWTGSGWSPFKTPGVSADNDTNADHAVWGLSVVAMEDGEIVRCRNNAIGNPEPGVKDAEQVAASPGGNHVWIRHNTGEYALYAHFQEGSLTDALCPETGTLTNPVPVVKGQFLGLVGNTGNSTGPHLHVHVQQGHSAVDGGADQGVPLLFRAGAGDHKNDADAQGADWWDFSESAVAPESHFR